MMRSRWQAVAVSVLLAPSVFGWGQNGHRAAAQIAANHLTPRAAAAVRQLLGHDTLPMISTWADEVRDTPEYRHTAPWHYVNIPDGGSYGSAPRNPDGDIVTALQDCEKILRDPKAARERKSEALKFYVHFVADIHQPLHAGRREDRGGNEVRVHWFREPTNLHAVWDTHLFEFENLSYTEFAAFVDHATPEQIRQWQSAGYLDWVRESMDLRGYVYEFDPAKPLGYPYAARHVPTVKRRLLQAGIRLAGKLNEIFP
jgi:hypothetical protein